MLKINNAHTLMLYHQGIISTNEAKQLLKIFQQLEKKGIEDLDLDPKKEDLYLNMEAYIINKLGDHIGGKLHTGRSRNDLYAAIHRLKCREEILKIAELVAKLRQNLLDIAEDNLETIIPGYTHMQHAQPVTYGHYLSALSSALERDFDRILGAYKRTNLNPLGAGALAGTGFPIDRTLTGKYVGFEEDLVNTLDAVASRDYIAEIASSITILLSNIGRICHDFYIWVTSEFSIIRLPDEFTVGSSIMPQKRNPIIFEHMMAKVSHTLGAFVSVITTMKSIPYTHTRATGSEVLHLLWKAFNETAITMILMTDILDKIEINKNIALSETKRNFSTATEVADEIVRNMEIPFRKSHEIVKRAVLQAHKQGRTSEDMSIDDFNESSMEILDLPLNKIPPDVITAALDPLENVKRRNVMGGPSPTEVAKNITEMRKHLQVDASEINKKKHQIKLAENNMQERIYEVVKAGRSKS